MTGIKIDMERIKNVTNIWREFRQELAGEDWEQRTRNKTKNQVAGYLTIAYMFGAEREDDGTGLKCELCGHRPCVLFGPSPKNCERCGGELILQAEIKDKKEDGKDV